MKHAIKYRAAQAALFVPAGVALFANAGLIMVDLGCGVALVYLVKELAKPFQR